MQIYMNSVERFSEIWMSLTRNQRRFVVAVGDYASKREAAEAVGISASTVYHWPPKVDEVVQLLQLDLLSGAQEELRSSVAKAALVKTEGLELEDARLRQSAASEILDRVLGKASARQDQVAEDGAMEIVVKYAEDGEIDKPA
jgi:hypothetical protein